MELLLLVRILADRHPVHDPAGGRAGADPLLGNVLPRWLRLVGESQAAVQSASHPHDCWLRHALRIL